MERNNQQLGESQLTFFTVGDGLYLSNIPRNNSFQGKLRRLFCYAGFHSIKSIPQNPLSNSEDREKNLARHVYCPYCFSTAKIEIDWYSSYHRFF